MNRLDDHVDDHRERTMHGSAVLAEWEAMTANLPRRVPKANLPRSCPPPPGGWFRTGPDSRAHSRGADHSDPQDIAWPDEDHDPEPPRALLRASELPGDTAERAALLVRVRDGIQRIPTRREAEVSASVPPPATAPRHARAEDQP